ncbi:MAG: hypothetical protein ACLFM2_04785 [Halothece sp.]
MVALKSQVKTEIKRMSKLEEAKKIGELVTVVVNSEDGSDEEQEALRKLFDLVAKSPRFEPQRKSQPEAFSEALLNITAATIKKKFNVETDDSLELLGEHFVRYLSRTIKHKECDLNNRTSNFYAFSLDVTPENNDSEGESTHLDQLSDPEDEKEFYENDKQKKLLEILLRFPINTLKNIQHKKNSQCNLQEVIYRKFFLYKFEPKKKIYKTDKFQEIYKSFGMKSAQFNNWYNPQRKKTKPKEQGARYIENLINTLKENENELTDQILEEIAKQKGELEKCYLEGYPKINASSVAQYCFFDAPDKSIGEIVEFFIDPYEDLNPQTMIDFLEEKCFPKIGAIIHCNLPDELK